MINLFDLSRQNLGVTEVMLDPAFSAWVEAQDDSTLALSVADLFKLYTGGLHND